MTRQTKRKNQTTPDPASNPETTPVSASPAALPAPRPAVATQKARNIKFIGRPLFAPGKRKILNDPQPIESVSFAGEIVNLPSADFQKGRRLFYHSRAGEIVAAFPHLYKIVRQKGR